MSGLTIEVDRDRCAGTTMCAVTEPAVFGIGDDGQSVVLDPAAAGPDAVVDAAAQCPMEAITVTDAESGDVLFP